MAMQVFSSIEEAGKGLRSFPSLVLTIGNFDGVHLGHQHLIRSTLDTAERLHATPVLLTFDPHPQIVLRGEVLPLLSSLRMRLKWIEELGIECAIVHPFTREFATTPSEAFLELLKTQFPQLKGIVVGYDFRFGFRGQGDLTLLRSWGTAMGMEIRAVPPWTIQGKPVSSSLIRHLLQAGDVAQARLLLGRPWQVWGRQGRGKGRGKTLGFPTINLDPENDLVVCDGVYGGRLRMENQLYLAAISVGTNPTFGEEPRHVEAHLIGFQGQLSGREELKLEFFTYLRAQATFPQIPQLIAQMEKDVATVQEQAVRERWLDLP